MVSKGHQKENHIFLAGRPPKEGHTYLCGVGPTENDVASSFGLANKGYPKKTPFLQWQAHRGAGSFRGA